MSAPSPTARARLVSRATLQPRRSPDCLITSPNRTFMTSVPVLPVPIQMSTRYDLRDHAADLELRGARSSCARRRPASGVPSSTDSRFSAWRECCSRPTGLDAHVRPRNAVAPAARGRLRLQGPVVGRSSVRISPSACRLLDRGGSLRGSTDGCPRRGGLRRGDPR